MVLETSVGLQNSTKEQHWKESGFTKRARQQQLCMRWTARGDRIFFEECEELGEEGGGLHETVRDVEYVLQTGTTPCKLEIQTCKRSRRIMWCSPKYYVCGSCVITDNDRPIRQGARQADNGEPPLLPSQVAELGPTFFLQSKLVSVSDGGDTALEHREKQLEEPS